MLDSLPVILGIGTVLGFLSGMGTGGGSLLMLWLTIAMGMGQTEARTVNLLFFIPSAVIACFFRWKDGVLDFKKVIPAIFAGCISAGVLTYLSGFMNIGLLQKLFGILLLVTGIRELLYRPRKAR